MAESGAQLQRAVSSLSESSSVMMSESIAVASESESTHPTTSTPTMAHAPPVNVRLRLDSGDTVIEQELNKTTLAEDTFYTPPRRARSVSWGSINDASLVILPHNCIMKCKYVDFDEEMLVCKKCNGRIHYSCTELPRYQLFAFYKFNRKYECPKCVEMPESFNNKFKLTSIKTLLSDMESNIVSALNKSSSQAEDETFNLKTENIKLKGKYEEAKNKQFFAEECLKKAEEKNKILNQRLSNAQSDIPTSGTNENEKEVFNLKSSLADCRGEVLVCEDLLKKANDEIKLLRKQKSDLNHLNEQLSNLKKAVIVHAESQTYSSTLELHSTEMQTETMEYVNKEMQTERQTETKVMIDSSTSPKSTTDDASITSDPPTSNKKYSEKSKFALPDALVITNSNGSGLVPKPLLKPMFTHKHVLETKNLEGAEHFIRTTDIKPQKFVILQILDNSLGYKSADQCMTKLMDIVKLCNTKWPNVNVKIVEPLGRELNDPITNNKYSVTADAIRNSLPNVFGVRNVIVLPDDIKSASEKYFKREPRGLIHLNRDGYKLLAISYKDNIYGRSRMSPPEHNYMHKESQNAHRGNERPQMHRHVFQENAHHRSNAIPQSYKRDSDINNQPRSHDTNVRPQSYNRDSDINNQDNLGNISKSQMNTPQQHKPDPSYPYQMMTQPPAFMYPYQRGTPTPLPPQLPQMPQQLPPQHMHPMHPYPQHPYPQHPYPQHPYSQHGQMIKVPWFYPGPYGY